MYEFFDEKTYVPNMSCGGCVTTFDIYFGRSHIVLCRITTFPPSFLMVESEFGTT